MTKLCDQRSFTVLKNTEFDVPYCGCRVEKIQTAQPKLNPEVVRLHHQWIFERYRIKKRKDAGELQPWTTDPVLRDFRFTNVFREDDRESRYLIDRISKAPMSFENKFYNTLLFRSYNKWETMQRIGGPFDWEQIDIPEIFDKLKQIEREDKNYVFFTNVFNTGGLKRASGSETIVTTWSDERLASENIDFDKIPMFVMIKPNKTYSDLFMAPKIEAEAYVAANPQYRLIVRQDQNIPLRVVKLVKRLHTERFHEKVLAAKDQRECFDVLSSVRGFGNFLAYQIFVDLTYIPGFKFSENEFTVSGPGCSLGLSYLFDDKDGMTDEEALFWVRDNIETVWEDFGLETDLESLLDDRDEYDRCLNVMSLENVFCETSKYVRAVRGTGRPRNKYKPFRETSTLEHFTS